MNIKKAITIAEIDSDLYDSLVERVRPIPPKVQPRICMKKEFINFNMLLFY